MVRRRQRQLSGRRAHALRARRRGEIGEAAPVASGRQRTRRRTSAAELAGSEAGAASGSGQFGKGDNVEEARTTRYLTREEEIELCAAVKREAQLQKLRGEAAVAEGRQLSDEEWAERAGLPSVKALHKALEAGQAAGLHIVKVNMGLLMKLTGKFHSQGMTQAELMVEAKQELLRVAEIFDASKGARLTTYAWYYIMSRITRMVMKESGLLPMSGALQQLARRMKTVEDNLSLSLGRNPTLAEIAAHVGITEQRAAGILNRKRNTISWDLKAVNGDKNAAVFGDEAISDGWEREYMQEEKERSVKNVIELALDVLGDERMRTVMRWRYGLVDGVPRSLTETAQKVFEYESSTAGKLKKRSELPAKPLTVERIRVLANEGRERMEAFIREHNLLRDLLN
ncbi:hypothetical protein COCSUDRAFT_44070 [Coccomyxa subellipsoidea C-169]|uniref:RNA polymerase sigma-70 region 3 domain-containing protein n=1 Tax=Coccomyxa subellipsoidea (strain C-169) TaxID=574566 RepID=I0YNY3_COCSC|nr:hypothetical protein COCSUDRAFT_44070 [Coccomyxa subellipsoidea C-169]EIE20102.1 hypothetical protein COCSUDRAFT_44070 [Coccomyxa subellipsoidea C-169]|eukprot:XP_005644646.1 hypothetical protein COCSUDRAFT_44070 [Coccomyxa subellipsoidea C-169]